MPACWGLTGEIGSGRKRVGIACRALSCRRVNHSGTLKGTEDGACSVAVSVYTCVHFPAGSELCSGKFHFDVVGFEELAFFILRFVLALTFCDLAFLLRPSLLYQRSVKRRHHWACPMCLCGTLRWSGGGGVVEGLLPSWKFLF